MKDTLQKLRKAVVHGQEQHGMGMLKTRPKDIGGRLVDVRSNTMNFTSYRWVLVLTLLAAIYYGLIASDRYVTHAQIYVKSTQSSSMVLPNLGMITGVGGQAQDALLLRSYIVSNDMALVLDEKLNLRGHFSDSQWDFISRMGENPGREDFLSYFRKRVHVHIDAESSILTVRGEGFTPEFSQQLVAAVLEEAERYLNSVSQKIAEQEISFIERQLAQNQSRMESARQAMINFQNENGLLSPGAKGAALQEVMNSLETELVQLRTEKKTLQAYLNERAPQIVTINSRIASVEAQLAEEEGKLAARDTSSINEINAEYELLKQSFAFTQELYQASLTSLEQAKVESYHKLKHLVVVEAPSMPDKAIEPRRLYNLVSLFVFLSLAYGIVTMILATIREHRDV